VLAHPFKNKHLSTPKKARNAVLILTLANILAFIDRQIPAMLIAPIKQDFSLSDSQIAVLGGAAFSLFYALMALPIGYAVDHIKRTRVLGTGIFLWSFMTVSAIFTNTFSQLFGARIGVSAGEAVVAPTTVSLIGDYYPTNKRGTSMAIITSGVYLGIGISLMGGGYLIDY
jgi:MFS family permease